MKLCLQCHFLYIYRAAGTTLPGRPVAHTVTWTLSPYVLYGVKYIDLVSLSLKHEASGSHLDVDLAPYVLYGVEYIGLVSLVAFVPYHSLDFIHPTAYVLYGVKYIGLVSLDVFAGYTEVTPSLDLIHPRNVFCIVLNILSWYPLGSMQALVRCAPPRTSPSPPTTSSASKGAPSAIPIII